MLVLTRKTSQRIFLGDDITIQIVKVDGNKVRIGIDAPPNVAIRRDDLVEAFVKAEEPNDGVEAPSKSESVGLAS